MLPRRQAELFAVQEPASCMSCHCLRDTSWPPVFGILLSSLQKLRDQHSSGMRLAPQPQLLSWVVLYHHQQRRYLPDVAWVQASTHNHFHITTVTWRADTGYTAASVQHVASCCFVLTFSIHSLGSPSGHQCSPRLWQLRSCISFQRV